MRAVNLLPEKHRPRSPATGKSGGSYVVLGVLGVVVGALLLYVVTLNSINSATTDIAQAKADTARATAQADALGAYGDFAKVKREREQAVRELAGGRFDWERMVRELAHVLPNGVWISSATAGDSADSAQQAGSAAGGSSAPAAAASGQTASSPVLTVQGCAVDQKQVANTLVRLREIQGASDVKLDHSTRGSDPSGSGGSSAGSSAGSASTGDCGTTAGKPNYEWAVEVTLTPPSDTDGSGNVPARLGGGS